MFGKLLLGAGVLVSALLPASAAFAAGSTPPSACQPQYQHSYQPNQQRYNPDQNCCPTPPVTWTYNDHGKGRGPLPSGGDNSNCNNPGGPNHGGSGGSGGKGGNTCQPGTVTGSAHDGTLTLSPGSKVTNGEVLKYNGTDYTVTVTTGPGGKDTLSPSLTTTDSVTFTVVCNTSPGGDGGHGGGGHGSHGGSGSAHGHGHGHGSHGGHRHH